MALLDVLHQFYSLVNYKLEGSVTTMGDYLLSNSSELGLKMHPQHHYKVSVYYGDSLYDTQHFRRALHYYELGLKIVKQSGSSFIESEVSETSVRWRIYKCHMDLKEPDEALTALVQISQDARDPKILIAMANLFLRTKDDNHSAATCFKQALRKCPLAMEAVFGLLSLGYSLTDVLSLAPPPSPGHGGGNAGSGASNEHAWDTMKKFPWFFEWLRAESMILQKNYSGAVLKLNELTQQGLKLSADGHCQLAFCMEKLGRKESSKELFLIASCQDVHVVNHMDMYARLLAQGNSYNHTHQLELLDNMCSRLLSASKLHSEPWVAQTWLLLTSKDLFSNVSSIHRLLKKATAIRPSAEAAYLEGYVHNKLGDQDLAMGKLSEALKLDSSFFEAYRDLIQCYIRSRPKRVVMNLTEMASKFLPPAQHLYLEGMVWAHFTVSDKAIKVLRRALDRDHTFEEAALLLSNMYCKMGQAKMAAKVLSDQLSATSSAGLHAQLGRVLMRLGQHEESLDHFHRALYLDPELKEAKEGTERLTHSLSPSVAMREEESKEEHEAILSPFQARILREGDQMVRTPS